MKKFEQLFNLLQERFEQNMSRHEGLDWPEIQRKLEKNFSKCESLQRMEESGGEPDVIGVDKKTGEYLFCDCSLESPKGRRSICYDKEAWDSRKKFKPASSAMALADEMGIKLLTEEQYRNLQSLGDFDTKTSSWLATPAEVREKGGAIFGDRRFGRVFIYHNGAESYYGARGFRGMLRI